MCLGEGTLSIYFKVCARARLAGYASEEYNRCKREARDARERNERRAAYARACAREETRTTCSICKKSSRETWWTRKRVFKTCDSVDLQEKLARGIKHLHGGSQAILEALRHLRKTRMQQISNTRIYSVSNQQAPQTRASCERATELTSCIACVCMYPHMCVCNNTLVTGTRARTHTHTHTYMHMHTC